MKHCLPFKSFGRRFAYVDAFNVVSSRTMPRKPISAFGINLVMPSSIPKPARRIGTTTGVGFDISTPFIGATGVLICFGLTLISRVASYERSVTNSSTRWRNVGESVFSSRSTVNLCAIKGWSATWTFIMPTLQGFPLLPDSGKLAGRGAPH